MLIRPVQEAVDVSGMYQYGARRAVSARPDGVRPCGHRSC